MNKTMAVKALVTARVSLLFDHPFYGNLATRLRLVEIPGYAGGIGTDGRSLFYDPDFVLDLDADERVFVVARIVLHLALDHEGRVGDRDPARWRHACDAFANSVLVEAGIGAAPKGTRTIAGSTADEVYDGLAPAEHLPALPDTAPIGAGIMVETRKATRIAAWNSATAVGADRTPACVAALLRDPPPIDGTMHDLPPLFAR